jgi:hypothetical protein
MPRIYGNEEFRSGKINIARPGGYDTGVITIEVQDEATGVQHLEIQLGLEDFASAVTGVGHIPCTYRLMSPNLFGADIERKTEYISYEGGGEDAAKKALEPYEVDGWMGSVRDATNHHRLGKDGYAVGFVRYLRDGEPVLL